MDLHRVTPDAFENYRYQPGGKYLGQSLEDTTVCGADETGLPRVVTQFPRLAAARNVSPILRSSSSGAIWSGCWRSFAPQIIQKL
jgi:hypothetical protein